MSRLVQTNQKFVEDKIKDSRQEEKKKNFFLSLGLIVFALCVTGATYAYFALTASNNAITGTVGGATLTLTVNKIVPTNTTTNMIPQLESTLDEAISSTYNCVDDHDNVVCQVYKATITNTGQATAELKGTIAFTYTTNSTYTVEEKLPNLKWKRITDATTIGEYNTYQALTTEQAFEESKVFAPGGTEDYYFVVWIDETGEVQLDSGTFNAIINFESADGEGITSTIRPTYALLSTAEVGSYVAYIGEGGTVGSTQVQCQIGGESSATGSGATEAPNSCLGQNAREDLEADPATSGTYGYCYNSSSKFTTTGWRIAYIDETDVNNPKVVLISAGSPECNTRTSVEGNTTYIKQANAYALKYCNPNFVDNGCTCEVADDETVTGGCTTPSTDAWAVNDNDFYQMTEKMNGAGFGRKLTDESSDLDVGSCSDESSEECGLGISLIDNGGYYWFAAKNTDSNTSGVRWDPNSRFVSYSSSANAYGLRPVISLSSSVRVTGGTGTFNDPYQISNS